MTDFSRRDFFKLTATAAVGAAMVSPLAALAAGTDSRTLIVDTGHGTNERFLRPLADNGVRTIFRYYAQEDNLPGKNLTVRERDMIFDHGLSIAIVYQHKARLNDRFNATTGRRDAQFCLERASQVRQPQGTAIYFGVDSDAHSRADVIEYLGAVQRHFGSRYVVGCYGSGRNCQAALDAGVARCTWVAQAPAWSGTRDFMNSGRWMLYQNRTQIEGNPIMSAGRVPIDANILNPIYDSVGAFAKDGTMVRYDLARLRTNYDRRRWVNVNQLNVRERPDGRVVSQLCSARTVHVLDTKRGWCHIDTDEDGRPDGWCRADYLVPMERMPEFIRGCQPLVS